jgi:hypothetical protein
VDAPNLGTDAFRAKVEEAPWSFFHLPVECWTTELALIAWPQVSFVLARAPYDFVPEDYFESGKWERFLELLCESAIVATLISASGHKDWRSFVRRVNDRVLSKKAADSSMHLPNLSDL